MPGQRRIMLKPKNSSRWMDLLGERAVAAQAA
jgi:hypothetical protein